MRNRLTAAGLGFSLLANVAMAAPAPAWENPGPPGGTILAIGIDPELADRIAVAGSAVAVSSDRGATWVSNPSPCSFQRAIHVRKGAVYLECGDRVLRSTDDGATWEHFTQVRAFGESVGTVLFSPADADTALVVPREGDQGQFTRADGAAWTPVSLPPQRVALEYPFALHRGLADVAFALVVTGDYTSSQYTTHLHRLSLGGSSTQVSVVGTSSDIFDCGRQVAVDAAGALLAVAGCRIKGSTDEGRTWNDAAVLGSGGHDIGRVQHIAASSAQPGHFAVLGEKAVLVSRNGGANWSRQEFPLGVAQAARVAVGPDGATWLVTGNPNDPPYELRDGAFVAHRTPFREYLDSVTVGRDPRHYVATSVFGLMRSADGGRTWSQASIPGYDVNQVTALDDGGAAFAAIARAKSGSQETYFFTRDGGASWQPSGANPVDSRGRAVLWPHFVGPQPGLVYGFGAEYEDNGFYSAAVPAHPVRSPDGGRTWTSIRSIVSGRVRSFLVSPANPRELYVTTTAGMFRSADGGDSWTPAIGTRALPVAIDAGDPKVLYGVSQETVWTSDDAGATWREAPRLDVHTTAATLNLCADPTQPGVVYAIALDGTLYRSKDRAQSWKQLTLAPPFLGLDNHYECGVSSGGSTSVVASRGKVLRVEGEPLVAGAGVWSNPSEPGWGVSIVQHASGQLFVVWYTYNAEGGPVWQVAPGGRWLDDRTFEGELFQTRASPYFSRQYDPSALSARRVGTVRLDFAGDEAATFTYTRTEGSSGSKRIERQRLPATRPSFQQRSLANLWWNHRENGAGIGIAHEGERLFVVWYAYDANGEPTWLVAPDVKSGTYAHRYTGDLYHTSGPADGTPFDPARVRAGRVGSIEVSTDWGSDRLRVFWPGSILDGRLFTPQPF